MPQITFSALFDVELFDLATITDVVTLPPAFTKPVELGRFLVVGFSVH